MDKQSIIVQLELDINALQQQVADFKNHPSTITSDEWELFVKRLDLMHAYCSKLKLDVQAERKMDEPKAVTVPVAEDVIAAPVTSEKKEEPKEKVKTDVEHIAIKEETITNRMEGRTQQDMMNSTTVELKAPSQKVKKQPVSAGGLFGEMLSVADTYKDAPTIADKIAQAKSEKSVADKMHRTPVKDLKEAIGINEKFLFINELFDGNLQDYSEAVNKLNASASLESAQEYIATLATRFNWTINDHVKNFGDLVARKFMS